MCKVAIVILNWNGSAMMQRYLPSVIQCSCTEDVEVIVADNASADDSISMLQSQFPQIRIIQLDKNYGFADGYNRALQQVSATYYLLLNSDVEIRQSQWLNPMISYMDTHPDTAACQPKLLKLHEEKTMSDTFEYAGASGGYIDRFGYPYCRGRLFATVEEDNGQYDDMVSVMWTTGAAMMVRADIFQEAGGFDARFFAHMEEIDLCWRMRIMGYDLVCIPQSTAYHLGGATLNQGNPRKTFLNFRNNLLMLYKNLPAEKLNSTLTTRWFLDMLAALQFMLKGDLPNMNAIIKAHQEFCKLKHSYQGIRRHIQALRKSTIQDTTDNSILWQYYARGRKTFRSLAPTEKEMV